MGMSLEMRPSAQMLGESEVKCLGRAVSFQSWYLPLFLMMDWEDRVGGNAPHVLVSPLP